MIPGDFSAFKGPFGDWFVTAEVGVDSANERRLKAEPFQFKRNHRVGESAAKKNDRDRATDRTTARPIIVNGSVGKTTNIYTRLEHGDLELECEFLIPKGSNAGVKFHGVYEIQIFDSFGKNKIDGTDCGGVYPRAELFPRYRHLDKGVAPLVNACGKPGDWQTLSATFRAPRFDAEGKKIFDARLDRAVMNGNLIHEKLVLSTPTGSNWNRGEKPIRPLMLQADHGPVAFRGLRVRQPVEKKSAEKKSTDRGVDPKADLKPAKTASGLSK